MAKSTTVWGVDIGNSSLKAIRCRTADEPGKVEALAFDYIEHSKILSQPGADPVEIVAETLQTFLSRNSTKGDKVAITVSGQNTISRFLRLPPVDPKKVPDMLKYEAKQWLPFSLDDVIWDFQPIGADSGSDGLLDSEIGMFAMKKEVAMRALAPYLQAGIDIDFIQSSPLSIYNYVAFDQLRTAANDYTLDPSQPPDHVITLCVGTDSTDVVITNGFSIWIRSIVIGGNNFTKALTKGLKLTFSKAEYLKRNAAVAQDPKAVFQAMKPVFNEMFSEVQRSIEYYQSLNRSAKFSRVLALGNAMKMPGLRQFLAQNLGYDVIRVGQFNRLVGGEVANAPAFKENMASFAVAYGLALQALDVAPLGTNLIPKEVVTERIIKEKKPWVLAMCASLLLGVTIWFTGASRALESVESGVYAPAEAAAKSVENDAQALSQATQTAVTGHQAIDTIGKNLTVSVEGRIIWNELLKVLNFVLPVEAEQLAPGLGQVKIEKQNRIYISNIDAINVPDLAVWFEPMKKHGLYIPEREEVEELLKAGVTPGGDGTESVPPDGSVGAEATASAKPLTQGEEIALVQGPPAETPGKVVQLVGYHYHNGDASDLMGGHYVRVKLLRRLKGYGERPGEILKIPFPAGMLRRMQEPGATEELTMKDLGIGFPTLIYTPKPIATEIINPQAILRLYREAEQERINRSRKGGPRGMAGGGDYGMMGSGGPSMGPPGMDAMMGVETLNPFTTDGDALLTAGAIGSGRNTTKLDMKGLKPEDKITLTRFDFIVQFAWVETLPSAREKKKQDEAAKAALEAQGGGTTAEGSPSGTVAPPVTETRPAPVPPEPEATPAEVTAPEQPETPAPEQSTPEPDAPEPDAAETPQGE